MPAKPDLRWRFDQRYEKGRWQGIWGVRLPWAHPIWSEYLMLAYDLKERPGDEKPILYAEGVTHEFTLYAVAPDTPINFDRTLFDQPGVSPLQPPNQGYQIAATDDAEIIKRLGGCVADMLKMELSPDTDFSHQWRDRFKDGVNLSDAEMAASMKETRQ